MCILVFAGCLRDWGRKCWRSADLDPRREHGAGAFVLIKSAFRSVPSAMNRRSITLHIVRSRKRCDGKRITAALNWGTAKLALSS